MRSILFGSALRAILPYVSGHGRVLSPPFRAPGSAFKSACGQQIFNTESSDENGNIQQEMQTSKGQSDFDPTKCVLDVCKGYQFADNTANVQTFTAGQVVNIMAEITAPHTGVMNVSVLNAQTNT